MQKTFAGYSLIDQSLLARFWKISPCIPCFQSHTKLIEQRHLLRSRDSLSHALSQKPLYQVWLAYLLDGDYAAYPLSLHKAGHFQ